jgi:hypothetical protein
MAWFTWRKPPQSRSQSKRPRRLVLEQLETRYVPAAASSGAAALAAAYDQLPLHFEANQGEADPAVDFLARGAGYTVYLSGGQAVLSLQAPSPAGGTSSPEAVVRLGLAGAASARARGLDLLPGVSNYLVGNDPSQWHTNIATYGRVEYADVYPGIDLIYHGNQKQLEYDFQVAPGADPSRIRLTVQGAASVSLDGQGDLVLHTAAGDVVEPAPSLYQEVNGARQAVAGHYVLSADGTVGFTVGAYDATRPLVIDPVLGYSTYLGAGGSDEGYGIAVDSTGHAYVTGATTSLKFPTVNPIELPNPAGGQYIYVTKFSTDGTKLIYSTYLGGLFNPGNAGNGIAVNAAGEAYVTGLTDSPNFPTVNAVQSTLRGAQSAVVVKLNASGSGLVYSTYLGGPDTPGSPGGAVTTGVAIAVDPAGNAFVTGRTNSNDFPTLNALHSTYTRGLQTGFVTKLSPGGGLVFSTYLGGNVLSGEDHAWAIAADSAGNAYVVGDTTSSDFPTLNPLQPYLGGIAAFVTKLTPGGTLAYSTTLGGTVTAAYGVAVDSSGSAYVTGETSGAQFPTTPDAFLPTYRGGISEAFVTKLSPSGSSLVYSTFLDGNGGSVAYAIAVDDAGNAYVGGNTESVNTGGTHILFPLVNPTQGASLSEVACAFVTEVNPTGQDLVFSTFLGGHGSSDPVKGVAVDHQGNFYVTGFTQSPDFPTVHPFQGTYAGGMDAFVTKFAVPQPLAAAPDTFTATAGIPLIVAAPGVLANDGGGTGPLTAVLVSPPSHGALTLGPDGSLTYVPAAGFSGTDTFTYQDRDATGLLSNVVTDTILVTSGTPDQLYVAAVFEDALGRAPDAASLTYWSGQLDAGLPRAVFANALTHSPEYYTNLINADYEKYLGRPADPAGLGYWLAALQGGLSDEHLEASFFSSPEYIASKGGLGAGWVNGVYQDELGRPADPAGQAYFLSQIAAGVSPKQLTFTFAASPEREAQRIGVDYLRYLHRPLDVAGQAYWVDQFVHHGASNENVIAGFLASLEYFQQHS